MWGLLHSLLGNPDISPLINTTTQITSITRTISLVFLGICVSLVTLYAIYIGFRLAKSGGDETKRKDAKAQLIYAIIGLLVITIVMILVGVVNDALQPRPDRIVGDHDIAGLDVTMTAISHIITAVLDILVTAAVIFGVYIGWQFMKAEDDTKRKAAKAQLIYTAIGVVAIVLINIIATATFGALATRVQ